MRILTIFLFVFAANLSSVFSQTSEIKNLVFEGAGIRGIAYAGVIKSLEERNVISELEKVGGTSAGGIIALLVALEYSSEELTSTISNTKFQKFNDGRFFFIGGFSRVNNR